MEVVRTTGLSYRFGRVAALRRVNLEIPEGALYALLGPNGAGKTTLLQILAGLRRPSAGEVRLLDRDVTTLTRSDRARMGYVSEDLRLPGWMTLSGLERWLAPLYPTWDGALADELRSRFGLDPHRKIQDLSRGGRMKAAMLCALAPRPRVLLLDEPFTGMDVVVKDELIRGLLDSAGAEGWTVLVSSHDIGELEALADHVGFLDDGRLLLSDPMEDVRERFRRIDVVGVERQIDIADLPKDWLGVEVAGPHAGFVVRLDAPESAEELVRGTFPGATRVDVRPITLRELFVALATPGRPSAEEVAA